MDNVDARELLVQHGLWTDELPQGSSVLAQKPEVDDLSKKLVLAYERALAADAGNKLLLAKICAHLRRSSGLKVHEIGEWLVVACSQWQKTFATVCRYVRAGEILLAWPQLQDVVSLDRLCTLARVPKKLQAEAFNSGLLPSGQAFRDLDREALTAAVNALRESKPKPTILPAVKARKEIDGFLTEINRVAHELAQLERFPQIQSRLQQMATELTKMLEKAMSVPKAQSGTIGLHNGRAQFYIR